MNRLSRPKDSIRSASQIRESPGIFCSVVCFIRNEAQKYIRSATVSPVAVRLSVDSYVTKYEERIKRNRRNYVIYQAETYFQESIDKNNIS